jgi:hypothetical protein
MKKIDSIVILSLSASREPGEGVVLPALICCFSKDFVISVDFFAAEKSVV